MVDKKAIVGGALFILALWFVSTHGTPPQSEAETIKEICAALQNKETCYGKAFAAYTKRTNLEEAFATLHKLQAIDPEARGCHFIAHSISIAETQKDPSKWKEVMANAPQECSYGAAHGALEVHASTLPGGVLAEAEIPTICPEPDLKNCMHILGHLLLVMKENDIDSSLQGCEDTHRNENDTFECLTGVFMERITALNLEVHGLADKTALNWAARLPELETLCFAQKGQRSVGCWKEIAHAAAVKYGPNMSAVAAFCGKAPSKTAATGCVDHSIGIIGGMLNFDYERTGAICEAKTNDPSFASRCYPMLVGSTLSTIPTDIVRSENFCRSIPSQYRESCMDTVSTFKNRGSATIRSTD